MNAFTVLPGHAEQIREILSRRANEIAFFKAEYILNKNHMGSVELALSREIDRLRELEAIFEPSES